MELLKSNPIIDEAYKPSRNLNYIDYFNRAMAFAQTNYTDQLRRVYSVSFNSITSTFFFEEYAWCLIGGQDDPYGASDKFPKLLSHLLPYCKSFWDLNSFPSAEKMEAEFAEQPLSKTQIRALHSTAYIINQGTKLFGWDEYKRNFLNSSGKLIALPGLTLLSSKHLSQNIGNVLEHNSCPKIHSLALHYKMIDGDNLVETIGKSFQISPKVIGRILWYAATTFDDQ